VNFKNAIKSGFRNYATFNGRASRSAYWWWWLYINILVWIPTMISEWLVLLSLTIFIVSIIPSFSVAVRRMHDVGRNGWWILVPIANFVLPFFESRTAQNQWGPPPPPGA